MKKFKVLFTLVIAVALIFSLAACNGSAEDEPNNDVDNGTTDKVYVVGTDAEYPPMESIDENGNYIGFDMDIIRAIAEAAGIKIEIKHTGWDPMFAGLDNGSIDLGISSITIREDRQKLYDFTDPYFQANQLMMVKKGSGITKLADLAGKNIGVQTATTGNFVVADAFGETYAGIKGYNEAPAAVDDLLLGRLDAVVIDNAVLQEYLKVVPTAASGFELVKDPEFEVENYGIAAKKGRTDGLINKVNEGLKKIKANGTYDEIFSKYFGE